MLNLKRGHRMRPSPPEHHIGRLGFDIALACSFNDRLTTGKQDECAVLAKPKTID